MRKEKEGHDQLLLAKFAVFIKFGQPVWGVALSPDKVSSDVYYLSTICGTGTEIIECRKKGVWL